MGTWVSALPPLDPAGGGGAGPWATCSPGGHGATWLPGNSSGFLKDRHGGEGQGMGSSVTQPPDLSLRLRQQQLPLPQNLAEDGGRRGRAFIYISPAGAKRAQADTSSRNPGRGGRVSHLGLLGGRPDPGEADTSKLNTQMRWRLRVRLGAWGLNELPSWQQLKLMGSRGGGGGQPALPESERAAPEGARDRACCVLPADPSALWASVSLTAK